MTRGRRTIRSLGRCAAVAVLVAMAALASAGITGGGDRTVHAIGGTLGSGGEYHPLTPNRILDSRAPALDVLPLGRKPTAPDTTTVTFDVPIVGRGGLPAFVDADGDGFDDNVLAVAVNVTVANPTLDGYLRAWGLGAGEGASSLVNFRRSETVANAGIVRPGRDGMLTIRLATSAGVGESDVIVDVFGWFSSSGYVGQPGGAYGARLVPVSPGRIFDSRTGAPLGANGEVRVPIRGVDASNPAVADIVPDDPKIVGVLLNITGVNNLGTSAPTYLALSPASTPAGTEPATSNLNLGRGKFRSSLAIVPLAADGSVFLFNRAGTTHAILDVVGYLIKDQIPTSRAGRVIPLESPFRVFDTRLAEHGAAPLPPANAEDWSFTAFANDVEIAGEPVGTQIGLIGNLTAANLGRQYSWAPVASYLTAYPTPADGNQTPEVSNLVVAETEVMPNMALIKYSAGANPYQVRFYNRAGYLDYLLDASAVVLGD